MSLMLVFDSDVNRHEVYRSLLIGHEVIYSTTCSIEVFEVTEGVIPTAIFIENSDPDCLRLVSEIRRMPNLRIVMIYLVGEVNDPNEFESYRQAASKCGANGFVPRPIEPAFFQLLVNRAVHYYQRFYGPDGGVSSHERQSLVRKPGTGSTSGGQTIPPSSVAHFRSARLVRDLDPSSRFSATDQEVEDQQTIPWPEHSNPLSNIAEMVGGWKELADVAYAFDIPSDPKQHERLVGILEGWGSKPPIARVLKAEELTRQMPDWIKRHGQDPVYLALLWIAATTTQRAKQAFWQLHCHKLVELVGEWLILSEILEQSGLEDSTELDRLLHHLKIWNDQDPKQIMVTAAGYCSTDCASDDQDEVYQVLRQIASEILFGSEVIRLQWESDGFSEGNNRVA